MGIKPMMLTGDNEQVARCVSAAIGPDEYFAEVPPHEKAARAREAQSRGLVVAMTGAVRQTPLDNASRFLYVLQIPHRGVP